MDEPWLRACKRLAIGQSSRFRCCGSTPAAIIYNKQDAWSMYCFRCHKAVNEHKQYQRIQLHEEPRVQPSAPADAICISQAPAETQSFIYGFLTTKGIMPEMVEDAEWSKEKQRIIFRVGSAALGRTVHARQQPKWVMYGQPIPFAAAGPAVAPAVTAAAPLKVVLTEDFLSARKIQHAVTSYSALNVQAIAMLGTRLPTPLRAWLIQNRPEVILMLDNDPAGHAGVAAARRALRPFMQCRAHYFADDPKDAEIKEILEALTWT
ncbi:MAG: toprim domain-containing protein [Anaerococcus sp.]|nr:toprim domain-containing protein [Anaerococcus sp.]